MTAKFIIIKPVKLPKDTVVNLSKQCMFYIGINMVCRKLAGTVYKFNAYIQMIQDWAKWGKKNYKTLSPFSNQCNFGK